MTDVMASVYNELNGEFNNMNNLVFFDIDGTLAIRTNVPASAEKALEISHFRRFQGLFLFLRNLILSGQNE